MGEARDTSTTGGRQAGEDASRAPSAGGAAATLRGGPNVSKPPREPEPPRESVPPAKPRASVAGPAPKKPAAQTLVGYEAPSPDTLIGYEAPPPEDVPAARASSPGKIPAPVARPSAPPPRGSGVPPRAAPASAGTSREPRSAPAKAAAARASAVPPRTSGVPPRASAAPPRPSAPPPPPPARPSAPPPPLANDEAAALDAMLGDGAHSQRDDVDMLSSQSLELLPSTELALDAPPPPPSASRPERTDNTEELTSLEVDRLSVGAPPPVPPQVVRTSAPELPTQKRRGLAMIAIPIVLVLVGVALYVSLPGDEPVAPAGDAAPSASAPTPAPATMAAAPTPTATPAPSTMAAAPAADTASATPSSTTTASAPPAPTDTAMTAAAPASSTTTAPADTSMAEAPTQRTAEAPAVAQATPGAFDEARLAALAPMPEVTSRIARMRESARASRAERELRTASRKMRSHDYEDAAEDYKAALAYQPTSVDAMIGLARIAIEGEQWEIALAWTQRALAVEARNVENLLLRGDAFAGQGDREAARATWRTVLEIDPRNRDARQRMRRRGGRRR